MKTQLKKHFVIPIIAEGFPCPAVMISGHLYWLEGEANCGIHELVSGYAPIFKLKREFLNDDGYEQIPLKLAIEFIENKGGVWVKENFDTSSVDDLREIKEQLPLRWVELFNDYLSNLD